MTDARLVSKAPEGSGLTHGLLDQLYDKRHKGQPIAAIPVVGLLKVTGSGDHDTAKGTTRHVKLEFIRLEPVKDLGDGEQVAWQITRAYESRTSPANGQTELQVSNSPSEKRRSLQEQLAEWAKDNAVDEDELDRMWVAYFGGPEYSSTEHVRDGSLVQLLEFVGYVTTELEGKQAPSVEFTEPEPAPAGVKDGSPEPDVAP